mmetsp:Transcript_113/g.306  ORF Transcript_113/g.306 Transcript_113/m.306 type:complete len:259 (-) Transcript_113:587-1363(-)
MLPTSRRSSATASGMWSTSAEAVRSKDNLANRYDSLNSLFATNSFSAPWNNLGSKVCGCGRSCNPGPKGSCAAVSSSGSNSRAVIASSFLSLTATSDSTPTASMAALEILDGVVRRLGADGADLGLANFGMFLMSCSSREASGFTPSAPSTADMLKARPVNLVCAGMSGKPGSRGISERGLRNQSASLAVSGFRPVMLSCRWLPRLEPGPGMGTVELRRSGRLSGAAHVLARELRRNGWSSATKVLARVELRRSGWVS